MEQAVGDAEGSAEDIVAYHEAGHAVIHLLFGHPIDSVTIIREGDAVGGVVSDQTGLNGISFGDDLEKQVVFERRIMAVLAGVIAQERYAPGSVSEENGETDRKLARAYLDVLEPATDEIRQAYSHLLELRTTALLDLHWVRVERVAKALLKKKTLTPVELNATFRDPDA